MGAWVPEASCEGPAPHLESFTVSEGTYLSGHLAIINPPQGGKIGRLGAVESVIEAGMVAIGKGDHELPGLLRDLRKKSPTGEGGSELEGRGVCAWLMDQKPHLARGRDRLVAKNTWSHQ